MPSRSLPVSNVAATCPRCPVKLPTAELIKHLWLEHRLLVEDGEVRDPWQMIDGWVQQYCKTGNPDWLQRCRALGARVDPQLGLLRVQRFFLKHGIRDPDAQATLLATARLRQASVCPHCFALVPAQKEAAVHPLAVSRGRLAAGGYRVEVFERTLRSRLEIEMPGGLVYRGPEPGRGWNRRGAVTLLVGPPVIAALVLALVLPFFGVHPLVGVVPLLVMAGTAYYSVHVRWREPGPALERAVDYAWSLFVPRLHEHGFRTADSAFLASLALTSAGHGRPEVRADILQRLLTETKKAVAAGTGSVSDLAALWRLAVADAATMGDDPVGILVTQVTHYFHNKLPLAFVEHLLAGCRDDAWLVRRREELRILLLERAFESSLEVRELTAISQAAPALRAVLRADDTDSLARLRLLWSMRPRRPWDRCGPATTAFDLASSERGSARLQRFPDLLLGELASPGVALVGRVLVFQDTTFSEAPRRIEVRRNDRDEQELLVDGRVLSLPARPGDVVIRFQRWCQFFFQEFLPELPRVYEWRAPNSPPLTTQVATRCPECRRALLTHVGELATEVEPAAFGLADDE